MVFSLHEGKKASHGLWNEGGALDVFDKNLSLHVFTLELPFFLEAALTVGGVWFGCPSIVFTLLPLASAAIYDQVFFVNNNNKNSSSNLFGVTPILQVFLVLFTFILSVWAFLGMKSRQVWPPHKPGFSSTSAFDEEAHADKLDEHKKAHDEAPPAVSGFKFAYAPFPGNPKIALAAGFILPPHFALLLTYLFASEKAHECAAFAFVAWTGSVVINEILKSIFKRRRPVVVDADYARAQQQEGGEEFSSPLSPVKNTKFRRLLLATYRHFPELQMMLRDPHSAHNSFPSGDAAGCSSSMMIMLLVLSDVLNLVNNNNGSSSSSPSHLFAFMDSISTSIKLLALVVACTAAFGRVFFHAHHLLDVAVGLLVGATVVVILGRVVASKGVHSFTWLHVISYQVLMALLVIPKYFIKAKGEEKGKNNNGGGEKNNSESKKKN